MHYTLIGSPCIGMRAKDCVMHVTSTLILSRERPTTGGLTYA